MAVKAKRIEIRAEEATLDRIQQAASAGAAEIGGGRLIVVDAIDDAAYEFYKHFDFIPVKNRRGRLVMKMSTAASALRAVHDEP